MENIYSHILVGQKDEREVFIEYGEYLKILKFAKAGASDGARGVLLGWRDGKKTYISKVIEAVYCGDEGLECPAFSPESWGRINAEINRNFSDLSVLGQFSSHSPLSPVRIDYIMQEKYFSKKSDLLFVFDPTENTEKMYVYEGREFVFLNGFCLYDKFETPINLILRENLLWPLSREYEIRMRIFDDIKRKIRKQNNIYAVALCIIVFLTLYNIIRSYGIEKTIENYSLSDRERIEWKSE